MLNGAGALNPASLTVSGGTLQGSQVVTVSGPFVWSGGTLGSAGFRHQGDGQRRADDERDS